MSQISIIDNAVDNLRALKQEVVFALKPHPVPQSDPRTQGLLLQFTKQTAVNFFSELPTLYTFIQPTITNDRSEYILAVNQTPPTHHNDFLMRPHIDRRWHNSGFSADAPLWTTVIFLDFPTNTAGGELIVFEDDGEQLMQRLETIDRKNARLKIAEFNPCMIAPHPGRICRFPGHLPHAVLGYSSNENKLWRLSIILAEFS